ncbi:MAG: TIGR02281 family clan AA aspartic protease, partial [Betaproteobacteria bacterium]
MQWAHLKTFFKTICAAILFIAAQTQAADISVTALFGGKAQLVIDGGKPRMLSAGQTSPEGVKLISADSSTAVIEFQGKRRSLALGSGMRIGGADLTDGNSGSSVTLTADERGHYVTMGQVNGGTVQFLVDTGA